VDLFLTDALRHYKSSILYPAEYPFWKRRQSTIGVSKIAAAAATVNDGSTGR
jgi:hypothetical protein